MTLIPEKCPVCGSTLVWSETGVDLFCQNIECPSQILYRIEYFLKTLGCEELSATTLEKFNLKSLEDVFDLSKEYIKSLEGFQEKRANTIYSEIHNSIKNVDEATLLAAFGIPGLGIKNAEKIMKKINSSGYDSFKGLFNISKLELLSISGIGSKLVECLFEYKEYIKEMLGMLEEHGLEFKEKSSSENLILSGMNITVTGAAPGMTRPNLEKIIKENGGNNTGISKKSTLLVAENINGNSSKLRKARELGIKIISYQEFYDMLGL